MEKHLQAYLRGSMDHGVTPDAGGEVLSMGARLTAENALLRRAARTAKWDAICITFRTESNS